MSASNVVPAPEDSWLRGFHAADRDVLAGVYESHHEAVYAAARRILDSSDAENVTHDVFYRLLSDAGLRRNFAGGSFRPWLVRVATHAALDARRRRVREAAIDPSVLAEAVEAADSLRASDAGEEEAEASLLVARFRAELPAKWGPVFDARFMRQLPQRQAAAALGIHRTTLIYYEARIRAMLRRFLLRAERTR